MRRGLSAPGTTTNPRHPRAAAASRRALGLLALAACAGCAGARGIQAQEGFTPIFDGETLAGLEGDPAYWRG